MKRSVECAKMLILVENPPIQTLEVLNSDLAKPAEKIFLSFFISKIWDVLTKLERLSVKSSALHTALDRALYENDEQKKQWMKLKDDAENEIQKIRTDRAWQQDIKKWSELSQGLTGDLPDYARRMWEDMELGEFTEKELPLLERLTKLNTEISNISNTSPYVPKLAATEKAINDIRKSFYSGNKSFTEAWQEIESYQKESRTAHGQDVATRAGELLNEAAKIYTKLAQSKGFETWADYVLAMQARHYAKGFKTPDERINFLRHLLAATKAPYEKFLDQRFKEIPDAQRDNFRRSQMGLIPFEAETLIREYFPKEQIEQEWTRAMLASGFDPKKLETIALDGYPRENKYSHAYMNCVSDHKPKKLTIDAQGLRVRVEHDLPEHWYNAQIFIVQNYRDDGPDAWTTAFHEGGHALDYSYREDLLGFGAAYGYVETHSMMMERFFDDLEYLTSVGKNREGKTVPKEIAQQYIANSKVNTLLELRRQIGNALFDLLVWKYPYTDSSESFVEHSLKLFGEVQEEACLAKGHTIDNIDWRMSLFTTSHFYSGSVRYFGYIVAEMAAELSAQALWDKLEKKTGRRTFYNQPSLSSYLIDGYYRKGFLTEFPKSIENFTGKPFSPEEFVAGIVRFNAV